MTKSYLLLMVMALLAGCASQSQNSAPNQSPMSKANTTSALAFDKSACLALKDTRLTNTSINSAVWNETGEVPADRMSALTGGSANSLQVGQHCIVTGEIGARTGADGKPYGTKFELRLPANWNSKLLFQGGGGLDGFVAPAVGGVPINTATATPALQRGYAVVSMDGGHPTPAPDFGTDQQARLDFAYQSIGKVITVAKALTAQSYQTTPKHSYFMGCSNGGREAMIATQRYPLEFDGVIAANAGFRLSRAAIAQQWDTHQLMKIAPTNTKGEKILANALTQADLGTVSQAVLKQCDGLDGLEDGLINAFEQCDFRPDNLPLSKDKISALKAVFDGAKDSKGNQIYSGWYYDAGINQPDWRAWKLGTSQTGEANARAATLGAGSLTHYFMTPFNPAFDVSRFDFDTDTAKTYQTGAINDAISTDLSSFKANGGKLILLTGTSDPVFSAKDQVAYFKALQADTAGADDFARLFMMAGMTHCGGGNGLDDVDPLTALENWHDKGQAPDFLQAKSKTYPDKTLPVCAYPKVATYTGGDKNAMTSYTCK